MNIYIIYILYIYTNIYIMSKYQFSKSKYALYTSRITYIISQLISVGRGNIVIVVIRGFKNCWLQNIIVCKTKTNKKAQLSLTNPRDAKACQKLLQFDVLTRLSLTILAYLHSFSCCCVRNLRNPEKFTENSNFWSSRSSKVVDLGVNGKPMCDFILVINSDFSRIWYRFRDIHG